MLKFSKAFTFADFVRSFADNGERTTRGRVRLHDRVRVSRFLLHSASDDSEMMKQAGEIFDERRAAGSPESDALKEALRFVFDSIEKRLTDKGRTVLAAIVDAAELILLDSPLFDVLLKLIFPSLF